MDPRGLRVTQNAHVLLLTNANQLLSVTFCGTTAGIGGSFWTHRHAETWTDGQTDMETEIIIKISYTV